MGQSMMTSSSVVISVIVLICSIGRHESKPRHLLVKTASGAKGLDYNIFGSENDRNRVHGATIVGHNNDGNFVSRDYAGVYGSHNDGNNVRGANIVGHDNDGNIVSRDYNGVYGSHNDGNHVRGANIVGHNNNGNHVSSDYADLWNKQ